MNMPLGTWLEAFAVDHDMRLAGLIDSHTKQLITDAYSFGLCTEETAIRLIYEHGLRYA